MEGKHEFYKRWWFWILIIIAILFIIFVPIKNFISFQRMLDRTMSTNENKIEEYEITQEYNGLYKFILKSNSGYTSIGVIRFDNGKCKGKYQSNLEVTSEISEKYTELEGVCGLNAEDNKTFYFTVTGYAKSTYQCISNEKDLSCKLKSKYNIIGEQNSELTLIYIGDVKDLDISLKQILKEERIKKEEEDRIKAEQEKETFIPSCQAYTFEQLARNPESVKGTKVKLTGEVVQVMEGTYSNSLRVNITKKGTYSTYYTDTIYVSYEPKVGEDKILEDDIITIYGTAQGDYSYTSTMGAKITLPYVSAKYIVLQK